MPLIGQDDETRKSYLEGILSSDYDFKGVVYHGFKKNKTNLDVFHFVLFSLTSCNFK